jgi:hypothetical protein
MYQANKSTYKSAIEEIVNSSVKENKKYANILVDYMIKLKTGYWEQEYVDAIFQNERDVVDLSDAFCFAKIHSSIYNRDIARLQVFVGKTPSKNEAEEENNNKLKNIPYPFSSEFIPGKGGSATDDGYLCWNKEISGGLYNKEKDVYEEFTIPPRTVPLEVGSTDASRSYFHLFQDESLARWPYGSEWIDVFVKI